MTSHMPHWVRLPMAYPSAAIYDISHASLGKTTDGVPQRGDLQAELFLRDGSSYP